MPQGVATEEKVLEVVENQLGRRILVRLYLIDDDLRLFLHLVLGEGGVENDVGQQLKGAREVFDGKSTIDHRFFLISIGIEVAAYILHAVQDMPGAAAARAFKEEMLHKMRHAVLCLQLVARAGIHGKAAIGHARARRFVDNAQSARQRIAVAQGGGFVQILHFGPSIRVCGRKNTTKLIAVYRKLQIFAETKGHAPAATARSTSPWPDL